MKKNHYLVKLFGVWVLVLALAACTKSPQQADTITSVLLGDTSVDVRLAIDGTDQARGLSGVTGLSDSEGMLFLFDEPDIQTFWMKDMLIPIDIVWIRDMKIVGVESSVLPPQAGAPDASLPVYASPAPVDRVLEVSAGFAERHGVAIGDDVAYR